MRIVIIGAGHLATGTAELLIAKGHEVVIVEKDAETIDRLSEEMDCSFLQGDGSDPGVLKQTSPKDADMLLCLTDVDQDNLIASLVGRSLGFEQVVTSINDPEYLTICRELGLTDTIVPNQTISRYLADMVIGRDILELTTYIKDTARFFSFEAGEDDAGGIDGLDLPEGAKAICLYRQGRFVLTGPDTSIRKGDEVVVLTHDEHLPELRERWRATTSGGESGD